MNKKKCFMGLILSILFVPVVRAEEPPDDSSLLRLFKGKREIMELAKPFFKIPGNRTSVNLSSNTAVVQRFSAPASTATSNNVSRVASAESVFQLGEVYCYPNPAKKTSPTFHIETGLADKVELKVYDIAGDIIHETVLTGLPQVIDDGQGPQYAYEYLWDVKNSGSGVYIFSMTAKKGDKTLKKTGRCAVIK